MNWTEHVSAIAGEVLCTTRANLLSDEITTSLLIDREHYISRTLNGQNKL
jgi:hypothetical protein